MSEDTPEYAVDPTEESVSSVRTRPADDPPDPWVHRDATMRCRTCMWFVPKKTKRLGVVLATIVGRCRKRAPSLEGYPVVLDSDWCGDHKLDENKVP